MEDLKNINGFLDNYIKRYGSTKALRKQRKYDLDKELKITTWAYQGDSKRYYVYTIGSLVEDFSGKVHRSGNNGQYGNNNSNIMIFSGNGQNIPGDYWNPRLMLLEFEVSIPKNVDKNKSFDKRSLLNVSVEKTMDNLDFKLNENSFDRMEDQLYSYNYVKRLGDVKDATYYIDFLDKFTNQICDYIHYKLNNMNEPKD